jgi:AcrR family transcriptional regulator
VAKRSDSVTLTEAERHSDTIRNNVPEHKRRSVVSENAAPTEVVSTAWAGAPDQGERRLRVDAQRNIDSLLEAAKALFASAGVDAPPKEVADLAGVGVGTLYRHFPRRADLVVAVIQRDIDVCAEAGPTLSASDAPGAALAKWLHRYTELLATKRGLATALHSGDPAFDGLPDYFFQRLGPTLETLLQAATVSGEIRADIDANDLLSAIAHLCQPVRDEAVAHSQRMVGLLIDGLRYGAAHTRRMT